MLKSLILVSCLAACTAPAADGRERQVAGWKDRSFELRTPAAWDHKSPLPVVLLLHGGGGNRNNADKTTCPRGDTTSPACFAAIATSRGYAVVIPDGTPSRMVRRMRTWNGGGGGAHACVSGRACDDNVDDVAYVRDLLAEVARTIPVDARRIFVTGMSNGGGMSHRLACELGDRIAAIASVAGGNQHAFAGGACTGGAAILEIHGTDDTRWTYATTDKAGVDDSMTAWAARNGCSQAVIDEPLPDRDPDDGATSSRRRWQGCTHATELIRSEGAGHTWPNGHPYMQRAGVVTKDFGSEVIVDFFDANPAQTRSVKK